jgi:HEPN domain-containing protein
MTGAIRNPQFAHNLLAMAHQDLKAARHLHEGGYYPQAVFYLEQSAEKGLKSYSIASGIIDEKEAWSDISHKTLKIYEKTTKNLRQRIEKTQENLKRIPSLEAFFNKRLNFSETIKQLDISLAQLRALSRQGDEALSLSQEDLKTHIKTLNDLARDSKRASAKIQKKAISPSEFRATERFLTEMVDEALADQPHRLNQTKEEIKTTFTFETYEKLTKELLAQSIPPMETFQSFFQLSIVLQPHAVARYPKSGFNPIELYTPDLPLIKSFLKLSDITECVLNQVEMSYQ